MITLIISICILITGYLVYSKYIERVFGADVSRTTPAINMPDGVDYLPMSWWRAFLIQFLNIAGLGPIFGAVAGAMWGPVAFLWIVLGSVFAGAVHDYFSGMLPNSPSSAPRGKAVSRFNDNWQLTKEVSLSEIIKTK